MIVVETAINNTNVLPEALVAITGTPSGTLKFYSSRIPDSSQAFEVAHTLTPDGTQYRVFFQHTGIWYLWAYDDNGFSPNFQAVFVSTGTTIDLDEVGQKLRDILLANKPIFDVFLKQWFANAELKQVVYGFSGEVVEFPAIIISEPKFREEYIGTSWLKQINFTVNINFMIVKSTSDMELSLGTRFARVGAIILNQPAYNQLTLPSGIELSFAMVKEGENREFYLPDIGFCIVGSCVWDGNYVTCDEGN